MPASFSRMISAACRRAVGTRPLYRPSRLALAIPSRWRSDAGLFEIVRLLDRHSPVFHSVEGPRQVGEAAIGSYPAK